MKFEIQGIQERIQILDEIRNPCFLSNWEKENRKREKTQFPKSKERIQILDNPCFLSIRIPIFPSQGMENHRFLSFWKREKREKPEFPNSRIPNPTKETIPNTS
jgi:hypothetical protein